MEKELIDWSTGSVEDLQCTLQLIESVAEYNAAMTPWLEFLHRPNVLAGLFTDPRTVQQEIRFDRGDRLVLGEVVQGDRLVAVVPLICRKVPQTLKFGLVTLGRLNARSARIADFEFPTEQGISPFQVFAAVVEACAKQKPRIDLVSVDSAPACAEDLREYGLQMHDIQTTYTIELAGGFDAYLQALSPRSRQKLKRTVRKFENLAEATVRFVSFRTPAEMNDLHMEVTRVWEKSWHARVGTQQVPSVAFLTTLASHGWVRAYVLFVGEQSVASVLGFQYRDTFYYESPAYDQDWQDRSPGIVLLYHLVENLFESDPPVRFDFGAGYGQYKQVFGTCEEDRGSIRIGITGRGKLIANSQWCLRALFRWCRAALDGTGIPRAIKRRIREGR